MKKSLSRSLMIVFSVLLVLATVGVLAFPRPELPTPSTAESCSQYPIHFDASSIERIYSDPEGILSDPQKFLHEDAAYLLLAESRTKGAAPFRYDKWVKAIEKLASQSLLDRQQQISYKLHNLVLAHQETFCREVGPHVLAYLPEGADISVTLYLTALDEPVPAYFHGHEIAISLSHPMFTYASAIHEPTALSSFFNLALQELFHVGFADSFNWPSLEEHMQNEVVIDMLISLQNEGIGTHIEHQLAPVYPSPFEYFLYLVDRKPVVRWYIRHMNNLFATAQTKPTGEDYDAIYRQIGALGYRRKGFYIVGAYMAMTIEEELGRDVLTQTVSDGYTAFADAYNSLADEEMKILWKPER
jgi:hypothetical protein